jgi:stearoyl-CoA desaturase (delta-9 desaturase)
MPGKMRGNTFTDPVLRRQPSEKTQDSSFIRTPEHLKTRPWYEKINLLHTVILVGIPLMSIWGLYSTKTHFWQTWLWTFLYYFWSGIGITAGYHRQWSHQSYRATYALRLFLMIGGSGALQGSIKWWSLLHRAHHRFTDTQEDPYNGKRGFFYSHCGWLLYKQIRIHRNICIDDLKADPIVRWQHKQFYWFGPFMSLLFPSIVAGLLWGDWRGGFYICGFFRTLLIQHATWCVNSVAHWYGEFTFDDTISPRDSIITGLITLGEGYHNFHHEFPKDYRNGIHWWDYDPTKWFIWCVHKLGLCSDLHTFSDNEIRRGELDMEQFRLNERKGKINYGVPVDTLPEWNQEEIDKRIKKDRKVLLIVFGIVHDLTNFLKKNEHPGGKKIILDRNGKEVTKDYNGGIYNHTNASRNLMSHMRVAKFVQ